MTDRELLELAAKAAGMCLVSYNHSTGSFGYEGSGGRWWNPLTDDGDALRLAVKLGMTLNVENDIGATAATTGWADGQLLPDGMGSEAFGDDPYTATRRAIVRAAAEIGREPQP